MVKEFDAHGDTHKDVWSEEQANQRSPFEGEARRYGEIEGATNMVRTWASLLGKMGRRLRVVTIWGQTAGKTCRPLRQWPMPMI